MLHLKTRWLFLITLWLWVATGQAADIAGYVTRFKNAVAVENATGRRPLALGEPLHLGDRVVTGTDARLEVRMRDSTVLTLGENTEFVIQQIQGITPNKDGSLFELLKGVFRAVTAQTDMAEQPREHWQVRTPVATIGIRGTELWGGFNLRDAGSNTLDVVMLEGRGVYVENAGQRVELKQAGEGTTVKGAGQTPTPIQVWGEKKLQAAQQTVAW
jgi:hypothetical protein